MKFRLTSLAAILGIFFSTTAFSQLGTWTKVTNTAPNDNMGVMVLLTDGTVLCHNSTGGTTGGIGTGWDRLTPDIHGSYINGTWTTITSMHDDRYCFASWIYPDGKMFVAGGEYGTGATKGEVYDPVANSWSTAATAPSSQNMYDCNGENLPDGRILIGAQNGLHPSYDNFFYTESSNSFATAPICVSPYDHDEAAWLKLPDSSILFVGIGSTASCRYMPKTNTWVVDGTVPVSLYDTYGEEAGPAFMLPNGKAIFFGATGHNAIYTPTGTSSKGTWTAAPDFPKIRGTQMGQVDAPGAMLPNGKILLAVCPVNTSHNNQFLAPTYFFEYDYVANSFTQVTAKISVPGFNNDSIPLMSSENSTFLLLPDGSVLEGINQTAAYTTTDYSKQYYIFTPTGTAIAAGQPTISSVTTTNCTTFTVKGTLFNGISEGAAYGDDWQMATNWLIVRLTNGTNVYYCKTTNWNRIGAVMTGNAVDSANFTLPASLPSGTYSLVVVANGNPSAAVTFTYPCSSCSLTTTASATQNVLCSGGNTGSASANPASGTTPYTYSWSNGITSSSATGLGAGTYTVTVKDKNACSATASVAITQPTVLSVSANVSANVNCNGNSTGSASATAGGGTSPYTYAWSGGGNNSSKSSLSAGTYTITLTDKNGCTVTNTAVITQPTQLIATAGTTTNVNCNGNNTGVVSATSSGGTSPYTYAWSGGGTNSTKTGLSAGTYTVTITDKNGCTSSASTVVTQPANQLTASATTINNINCNGNNNGVAGASALGGTSPYTYVWSDGGTNTAETGLSAGTYTLTATDDNGCTASSTTVITQPITLAANAVLNQNATGCASNGSATSTPSGGTSPYTFAWSPGGNTNSTASGLSAGIYTVTVTDANSCTTTAAITITAPTSINPNAVVTQNSGACSNTGIATSSPSGGTSPYTFLWSNGSSNSSATGLSAGTYTVSVNDANNCSNSASVVITAPATLNPNAVVSQNSGACGNTGIATSTPSGGTSPYTYSWSNGSTTPSITGLSAGTYTVTVHDANNCSGSASVIITAPAVLGAHASVTQNAGSCDNAGIVSSSPTGGTSPYTYAWTGGSTNPSVSGLSAGSYTVTVHDASNCSVTASVTVTGTTKLTVTAVLDSNQSPCTNDGMATASGHGGTAPYTYSWSPGGKTGAIASGLSAGTYTVTVHDKNGCSATVTIAIGALAVVTATDVVNTEATECANTGKVTITGHGGRVPYTYSWAPGGNTTNVVSGLSAGTYTVTVKDKNACSGTVTVTITKPAALVATLKSQSCVASNNGTATVSISGGKTPYTYSWSPGGGTSASHTGLTNGSYTVTVTDKNSCTATLLVTVNCTSGPGKEGDLNPDTKDCCPVNTVSVYPNPNNGQFTLSVAGKENFVCTAEVYNMLGEKVYFQSNIQHSTSNIDISNQPNGVYLIRIINADGTLVDSKKVVKTN